MKPKLLVLELWGLGDLVIVAPFLRAAAKTFSVTLLAKPFAHELAPYLWPEINVISFMAPWTAFRNKYQVFKWDWRFIRQLISRLRSEHFEYAVSSRWDPRDHLLMRTLGVRTRIGFGWRGSEVLLRQSFPFNPKTHRFHNWEILAEHLGLPRLERRREHQPEPQTPKIVVHTGAGQIVRVWALEKFAGIVAHLRSSGYRVKVVCDPGQREWWLAQGESEVVSPGDVSALLELLGSASLFIGNDSGPGHLAAIMGIATFTVFGPQEPAIFAPIHPTSEWIEGRPCRYKPCFDSCRFAVPHCLADITEDEVWQRLLPFVQKHTGPSVPSGRSERWT